MRIGLVCPYSFDVPGGVQFHIRDLAGELIDRGHEVSVLAPAEDLARLPAHVVAAGGSVPIHYNGSVARLSFGPLAARRTRRWLAEGAFDLLHVHEPVAPSLSMLAMLTASGPLVATFHSAQTKSRAMRVASPLIRGAMEKIVGAISVSEDARRTVMDHLGVDSVIIPNGVHVDVFAQAAADPRWRATAERPVVAFLGRLDEPRKGLKVALAALPRVRAAYPGVRLVVAGAGDAADELGQLGPHRAAVELAGPISDAEKAGLFKGCSVYIAPQLGGESFGIVLVEAMAAGAPVAASDMAAFRRVLDDGRLGRLFRVGDAEDLAAAIVATMGESAATGRQVEAASLAVRRYDWSTVTERILAVYETVSGR
ncbi:MAG: glycosyltransferase family 4 protein [Bifidobacteriaceae bacterium]|jgi:phosphatidylinositol alpha-mannosyltransferase|nr:glycosyltransferase family 4 protein [Bifidobacteriaceae bacterium]